MSRTHNFTAGPAVLPLSVIRELQEALPEYGETELGLMEFSHRSIDFQNIHDSAKSRLRSLLNIPKDYTVLFLQGGASLQFYMAPLNLLNQDEVASYILTGTWSKKALVEAQRCSKSSACWKPESIFNRVPKNHEYQTLKEAIYLHYTSNNTIFGTQFHEVPHSNQKPLVCDMSSDICSKTINVSKYDVIYAGAQKNLGPSGITVVILSPWAIEKSKFSSRNGGLPSMLNYALMKEKDSLFNTPNTFGIFALDRMLAWLQEIGGVSFIEKQNKTKAAKVYNALESSSIYNTYADTDSRSLMNITWKCITPELEALFIEEANKNGLKGLKGHRSVGGIRASIYNACPLPSIDALVDHIIDFSERYS